MKNKGLNRGKKTRKHTKLSGKTRKNCVYRTTADPRVFGPYVWTSLHMFAEHYPEYPTKLEQKKAKHFITSLPWMLPCYHCGCDLHHFTKAHFKHTPINRVVAHKDNMINFFRMAHNNVSSHTKNQRSDWSYQEVREKYGKKHVCLGNKKLWKGCALKRSLKIREDIKENSNNKTKKAGKSKK